MKHCEENHAHDAIIDKMRVPNAGTKPKWDKTNAICNCLVYEFKI